MLPTEKLECSYTINFQGNTAGVFVDHVSSVQISSSVNALVMRYTNKLESLIIKYVQDN